MAGLKILRPVTIVPQGAAYPGYHMIQKPDQPDISTGKVSRGINKEAVIFPALYETFPVPG
jgi:hypothetical protein